MPFDNVNLDNDARLLLEASNEIERRGWTQQRLCDLDENAEARSVCVVGALMIAADVDNPMRRYDEDAWSRIKPALWRLAVFVANHNDMSKIFVRPYRHRWLEHLAPEYVVTDWNDHRDRTYDDVVETLRRSALTASVEIVHE